jgi:predicted SAM-dependent methyltransferase
VCNFDIERERFPFDDECMDVIIINQVMEHVKEVFWILHKVSRILKTRGHFIVGVPNLAFYVQRLLLLIGEQHSCIKNYSAHVRGYTKGDIT